MTRDEYLDSLPEGWRAHFPRAGQDASGWAPCEVFRALASRVLAVAHTRIEGRWCAYVDAVPGINHRREIDDVLRCGAKLDEAVALTLFPRFQGIEYAE